MTTPNDLISPRKAAAILAVSVATIYRMVAAGELRAWHVRSLLRISEADVRAMLVPVSQRRALPQAQAAPVRSDALEQLRKLGWKV